MKLKKEPKYKKANAALRNTIFEKYSKIDEITFGPRPSIFSKTFELLEDSINLSKSLNSFAKTSAFTSPTCLIPSE